MNQKTKYGQYIFLIISTIVYYHIGYQLIRSNFLLLVFDFVILFALYFWAIKNIAFNWWLAIIPRLVLLFSIPSLSDDYLRFIWDGNLIVSGINPLQYLPTELISTQPNDIFNGLNSKNYYSVYPPLLQLIFAIGSFLGNNHILANIIVLRVIIIATDLGSIYLINKLLKYFKRPKNQVIIYALNPLIIAELTGNLHFEAVMIFFILLSFWLLLNQVKSKCYFYLSALFLACSILIKLLPLVYLPLIIRYLGWKKGLTYSAITGTIIVLACFPFFDKILILHIFKSINLYFQNFEFNASFYYLVKWMGIFINHNNPIQIAGPLLSAFGAIIIFWISFKNKILVTDLFTKALTTLTIYFFMATTVHPWYLSTLVCFACFTNFRYAVVWSGMAILSYSAYQSSSYHENLWLVGIEYFVVFGVLAWEINKKIVKNSKN
jgi:alpha-1,6-mannosyltransferase